MNLDWFKRKRRSQELDEELESHLSMATSDRVARGEPLGSAAHAARREMGNYLLIREVTQDIWGGRWWRDVLDDARYGLRVLWKNPRFLTVAALTLALGIGANTALFSVVNGILLNPLPYPQPEELVTLHESKPNFSTGSISFPNFLDWQKDNQTFSSMAVQRGTSFILTGLGDPEQIDAQFVSANFFRQLGVVPAMGRDFAAGEDLVGAAPVAMITASFWKRKLGSAADVIGKSLTLDGRGYTVIGVVPANFDLLGTMQSRELYVPVGQWNNPILMNRGAGLGFHGIGRLKPGVSVAQARSDMERVTRNLAEAFPDTDKGIGASLIPLRERVLGQAQPFLLILFGAVGFVLLIACVNVANLQLARSNARIHEFAVRDALGAGRSRILRQLLTESVLLAGIGGGLGVLVAAFGTKAALRMLPETLPRAAEVGMDARVLLFAGGISLLAGVCFGLLPALKISNASAHALKEGGRGASGTRHRVQRVLVAAEMALALVLLIGAGLMIRTLTALWGVSPGFDTKNVLTFGFALPPTMNLSNADSIRAALRDVHEKFASVPGVQAVSFSWGAVPLSSDDEWLFWVDGQPKPANDNDMNWALNYVVEPDYLSVMGIPLRSGRFFTSQDDEHAQKVAVIDEALASKFFGGRDPVGKRLHLNNGGDQLVEIVGVVGHVKQWSLDGDEKESLQAQLYTPLMQLPDKAMGQSASGIGALVRSQNSVSVFESIRQASLQMSRQQVVFGAQSMREIIANSLAERRFSMILLGVFAAVALVLASVGIYGVVSYVTGQRTQEMGVRIALGAQRGEVLRLVLRQGITMAVLGVGIGLAAAVPLTRLMGRLLFAISAADPLTYLFVIALLLLVSMVACWMPARRAARMNPVDALRYE